MEGTADLDDAIAATDKRVAELRELLSGALSEEQRMAYKRELDKLTVQPVARYCTECRTRLNSYNTGTRCIPCETSYQKERSTAPRCPYCTNRHKGPGKIYKDGMCRQCWEASGVCKQCGRRVRRWSCRECGIRMRNVTDECPSCHIDAHHRSGVRHAQ